MWRGQRCPHVKGGSSSLLLRKAAGSGSWSHGGNTFPWSLEDRSRIVFSPVGSVRVCRGPLGLGVLDDDADAGGAAGVFVVAVVGAVAGVGLWFLRVSAKAMSSRHLRLSRVFAAALGASLTALMYSSAAWMACERASWPEVWVILASCSCWIVSLGRCAISR